MGEGLRHILEGIHNTRNHTQKANRVQNRVDYERMRFSFEHNTFNFHLREKKQEIYNKPKQRIRGFYLYHGFIIRGCHKAEGPSAVLEYLYSKREASTSTPLGWGYIYDSHSPENQYAVPGAYTLARSSPEKTNSRFKPTHSYRAESVSSNLITITFCCDFCFLFCFRGGKGENASYS